MPDVLFVDEDGNPIEPGRENIVYIDENGVEIPEEVAIQLLESGRYVDSRELVNTAAMRSSLVDSVSQAQLQSSQAHYQAQMEAKMQAMALAEAQAQVFAKVQAEMKQREDELASIEADAARGQTPITIAKRMTNSVKSISSVDLQIQKSQSGRRILQPPAKKLDTQSSENLQPNLSQTRDLEAQAQLQRIAELKEHEILKEKLLLRQRQIMQEQLEQKMPTQSQQSAFNKQMHQRPETPTVSDKFQHSESVVSESKQVFTQNNFASTHHEQLKSSTIQREQTIETHASNTPVNLNATDSLRNKYDIGKAKFVGFLTGKKIIRDISQLSEEESEKIYQEAMKDQIKSVTEEDKNMVNDLDPSIFSDELVEIDFGPIDAYTAALNAHLNAHKNASEMDDNKRFPAHVITCSHATFIDHQLILGEPMYNTFESNNVEDGNNDINVELYQPDLDENQERNSRTNTQAEYEHGNYSQSQSFASLVDIQSQPGYSIREMNQFQESNFFKDNSRANFDSYFDSIRSKQSNGGFYANTENLNTNYVSR